MRYVAIMFRLSLKYLLLILAVLVFALPGVSARDFVVVIDAGHGGKDPGSKGKKGREKEITLDVAKQLATRINKEMKGVKAVLTRSDDRFVELQERASIANRAGGDLFISIHVNSLPEDSPARKTTHGVQVFTLGPDKNEANLDVAMRENSVIELEKDYTRVYKGFDPKSTESYIIFELNQNAHIRQSIRFAQLVKKHLVKDAGRADKGVLQSGFQVLYQTSMPAVLVELDFISNPKQETFLNSAEGRKKCAGAIYNAVAEYVKDARH